MRRPLFVLLLTLLVAIVPSPAHGQSTPEPFDEELFQSEGFLTVTVHLNTAGDDVIELENASAALGFDRTFDFGRNVAAVFGVSDRYEVRDDTTSSFDDPYQFEDRSFLDVDGRLLERTDDGWRFTLDAARLTRLVSAYYAVDRYNLRVCPPDVEVVNRSTFAGRQGSSDDCVTWLVEAGGRPLQVQLLLEPEESDYWDLLATVGLWSLGATLVLLVPTTLLRRGFKHMRAGAIVTSLCAMTFAILTFLIALIPFANIGSPVDDLVLARDLEQGGHIMAVVLPALICSIPFMAMAIGVVQLPAPPNVGTPRDAMAQGGAPGGPPAPRHGGPPLPDWLQPDAGSMPPPHYSPPRNPPPGQSPPLPSEGWGSPAGTIREAGPTPARDHPATDRDENGWQAPS